MDASMFKINDKNRIIYAIIFAFLLSVPLFVKNLYYMHILIVTGIWVILVISKHLILFTGIFSLGHAAFMGIGAYSSAILMMKLGWPFWVAFPLSGIVAALVSVILCSVFLRVKGLLFAVITIAFAETTRLVFTHWPGLGGAEGLTGIPAPTPIPLPWGTSISFAGKIPHYYLVLITAALAILFVGRIEKSRLGRMFSAIEENEQLVESIGVHVKGYRLLSMTIAGLLAGLAGSLYGHYHSYIAPDEFAVWTSVMIFLLCVIGGMKSLVGPVIGAIFLTFLPEIFREAKAYEPLIFAVVVLLIIFFLPGGLMSLPQRLRQGISGLKNRFEA